LREGAWAIALGDDEFDLILKDVARIVRISGDIKILNPFSYYQAS